jgi:hypothetical protein
MEKIKTSAIKNIQSNPGNHFGQQSYHHALMKVKIQPSIARE